MKQVFCRAVITGLLISLIGLRPASGQAQSFDAAQRARCEKLVDVGNLTITSARLVAQTGSTPPYCYAKGLISAGIRYHVQLPLPGDWNGRYLNWGDGGKDGDLDFADHRLAEGYAVSNSNMGHDSGSEPGASFGYNNRAAEIDFGYRAVHLMSNAAKTLLEAYYGRPAEYAYHEGCSTGGRQGLMEAQRFPHDFDGIVAGAPVAYYQELHAMVISVSQKLFADDFAGNLAFDKDGDGVQESLTKLETLASAVLAKCDTIDGIEDGVIDDPLQCDFDAHRDLGAFVCEGDINGDRCFTSRQLDNIAAIYAGIEDQHGRRLYKGMSPGSELAWLFVPHAGNGMQPFFPSRDHMNYLFYENDPGIAPANMGDIDQRLRKDGPMPEWGWWEFDIQDFVNGSPDFMRTITNATDPDLRRYLRDEGGKLLLYHGWGDANVAPEPVLDYYVDVVATTFDGDLAEAREHARLFMAPGMYHCSGGPGPDEWDRLAPLVEWVEQGRAPERIIARHSTAGRIDNERPLCPYPETANYVGPPGGAADSSNWTAENFVCE
jgi:hypothetical protein